jgi:hypothetical protein
MNAAVLNPMWPLKSVMEQLDREFGKPVPLSEADKAANTDADKEAAERDQLRAEYVARRRVELVGRYWRDDEKVDEAFAYAAERVSVGMRVAFRNDDIAELGRMVKARMGLYMHDQAAADAECDGFNVFPVLP